MSVIGHLPNLQEPGSSDTFYILYMRDSIDDFAKDGGEELFTKMHCAFKSNSYRIIKES